MFPKGMPKTDFIAGGGFLAAAILLAGGCAPAPAGERFAATGELIALSGGDAGAAGACHVCHGMKGEGDGNLVPRIAGLNPGYIVRQLGFFADGQRQHEQMSWIAQRLDPGERVQVAQYYAEMTGPSGENCPASLSLLYISGDISRDLPSCASCHEEGQDAPSLAGQPRAYLDMQMKQWRIGERYGDPRGEMRRIARALSPEEIAGLWAPASGGAAARTRDPRSREECP